jgi:hypothetical protein
MQSAVDVGFTADCFLHGYEQGQSSYKPPIGVPSAYFTVQRATAPLIAEIDHCYGVVEAPLFSRRPVSLHLIYFALSLSFVLLDPKIARY